MVTFYDQWFFFFSSSSSSSSSYIYIRNQGRYDDNPHQKITYDSGGDGEYDDDDNGNEDDD